MKKIISILISAAVCLPLMAQQSVPEKVPTPNAASLGHYGDIPVSYYTGNPGISVPLYEMTVRGVTFPIKLDYDASGVQMNVLPSWTGYNWTLSAGGAITRKVNGFADEWKGPNVDPNSVLGKTHRYFDCYNLLSTLNNDNLADCLLSDNTYDFDPDVFYFNFMGKSGKFWLGNDGQWKVNSDFDIDVIFDVSEDANYLLPFIETYPAYDNGLIASNYNFIDGYQPKTIAGFRLRDTDGVTYEFGYTTDAIEYNINFTQMGDAEACSSWIATSWYLTKVTDRLGNVLYELTYERGPFFAQPFRHYEYNYYKKRIPGSTGGTEEHSYNNPDWYSIELNAPVYLDTIKADNGVTLTFERIDSPQEMETLYANPNSHLPEGEGGWYNRIKNFSSISFKDDPFYYLHHKDKFGQYYYAGANDKWNDLLSKMRLQRLDGIKITDHSIMPKDRNFIRFRYNGNPSERMHLTHVEKGYGSSNSYAAYSFIYDNFDKLPVSCLTPSRDHWGYYNGLGCGDALYSEYELMIGFAPDTAKMKYGSLTGIVYPTGGVSVIEYEPNDYTQVLSLDRQSMENESGIGGGLRVKSITEYEDPTLSVMLKCRRFTYTNPSTGSSSGQLFAKPVYGWYDWVARKDKKYEVTFISTIRSSSIVPLSNSFGPAVGYSWVKETFADSSSTLYHYHNLSDGPWDDTLQADSPFNSSEPSPYDKFTENGYYRGKLLSTTMKDSLGNKVASTSYEYRPTGLTGDGTWASNLVIIRDGGNFNQHVWNGFYYFTGRKYKMYYQRCDLASRTDTLFYDGGESVETENYEYADSVIDMTSPYSHESRARLLSQKTRSRGDNSQSEHYSYPMDPDFSDLKDLATGSYYLPALSKEVYYNGTLLEKTDWEYADFENVNGKPQKLLNAIRLTRQDTTEDVLSVSEYTTTGQVKRYKKIDEPVTWLTWAKGNENYLAIKSLGSLGSNPYVNSEVNISDVLNDVLNGNDFLEVMRNRLSGDPGDTTQFVGYSYFDSNNVSSSTNQRGLTTLYDYNKARQLTSVKDRRLKDDQERLLKKFEYNFKNKEACFEPLSASLQCGDFCYMNGQLTATVSCGEGPRYYSCHWEIVTADGAMIDLGNKAEVTLSPMALQLASGQYCTVKCTVEDLDSGEKVSLTRSVYIKPALIYFDNIVEIPNPSGNSGIVNATIYCDDNAKAHFQLQKLGAAGTVITVTVNSLTRDFTGSNQNEIDFDMNLDSGVNYVQLKFTNAQASPEIYLTITGAEGDHDIDGSRSTIGIGI